MLFPPVKVAILGAGISGLSLAWYLQKDPSLQITLFDRSMKVGGLLQTEDVEKALYECGAHTLRLSGPYKEICLNLFKDLNLSSEFFLPKGISKKLLLKEDQLLEMPSTPLHLLKPYFLKNLVWPLIKEPFLSFEKTDKDVSIYSFFSKRYGEEFYRFFIDPMVTGIFGGDPKTLSLLSCFPQIASYSSSRSLLYALWKQKKENPPLMMTFKNGLRTLTWTLQKKIQATTQLGQEITGLSLEGKPTLFFKEHQKTFDYVFSALPAKNLKELLQVKERELATSLELFSSLSYKVIHLGFSKKLNIPKSFGFLSPSWSKGPLQGVIFDSFVTPLHDSEKHAFRLTVILSERSKLFSLRENKLLKQVKKELEVYFKQPIHPHYEKLHFFPEAITQYTMGHTERVSQLEKRIAERTKRFFLVGKSFYGGSVPACIAFSHHVAETFLKQTAFKQLASE